MLVLARKKNESIILTVDDKVIKITVTSIEGSFKCRIGIDAPRDVVIMREELIENAENNQTKE